MTSTQDQFLKDLDHDQSREVDILDQPLDGSASSEKKEEENKGDEGQQDIKDEDEDGDGIKPRNRRERRLIRQRDAERESSIFLAGKLAAREEGARTVTEESDYLKSVERIYGTDTPEAQIATDLLKKAIVGARDDARREAVAEMKAERQREQEAEKNASSELDGFIEDIEDTYDVTLTPTQEASFFGLLQKMSPKDAEGHVVNYADPHAVWEVFSERLKSKGTDNRAKDLSARSMTQSGASQGSTLKDDAATRYLKDAGII